MTRQRLHTRELGFKNGSGTCFIQSKSVGLGGDGGGEPRWKMRSRSSSGRWLMSHIWSDGVHCIFDMFFRVVSTVPCCSRDTILAYL